MTGWGTTGVALVLLMMGCGGSSRAHAPSAPAGSPATSPTRKASSGPGGSSNLATSLAQAALEAPCAPAAATAAGPVPKAATSSRTDAEFGHDVVFYLAHPEDETLFTAGTMETLVLAKKRVFDVVLSHGEGGRLLDVDTQGDVQEATAAPEKVAEVRDREFARVMETLGIHYDHLYPASARADFAANDVRGLARAAHGCDETMKRWQELLPDGIAGVIRKLVGNVRTRRPRIVITHDPRDDEDWLDHGHHKALGALVEIAIRLAADPRLPGERPHVVEELVTIAPKQVRADVTLHVKTDIRKKLMTKSMSQFDPKKFADAAQRTDERYVIRWRAQGAESPPGGGSLLGSFLKSR